MDPTEGASVECDPVEELLLDMLKRHRESKKPATAGKYRKGGSGTVFQRFDEQLGRDIAVKIIDYSDSKQQEKAIVDLKREYHSLRSLDHPSIVRFLGFTHNKSTKQAFIRMEWAATELSESVGGAAVDLADLINQHAENYKVHGADALLPEAAIWQILFHLTAALALCHHGVELHRSTRSEEIDSHDILPKLISDSHQSIFAIASQHPTITWRSEQITFSMKEDHRAIVHRDIKPRNILITDPVRQSADDQWRVPCDISLGGRLAAMFQVYPIMLLGDFGLSAPLKDAHTCGIGSIGYTAPEVLSHTPSKESVDFQWTTACDIFSLGATLLHLMTLDSEGTVTSLPKFYSEALRTLVIECLSIDHKKRPTAFDLLGACISNSNWNTTYVSPYGLLIASDFNSALFSSWYVCRTKYERITGLTSKPLRLRDDPIITSAIQLLAQKAKEGKEALRFFIAGAYFLGLSRPRAVTMLPYRRQPGFVGREEILSKLSDLLHANHDCQSTVALYGLGGIGKTQIALEFAYRLQTQNPLCSVYWVYASTASRFEDAYRQIAIQCKIPGCDDPKRDWMLLVRVWLESPRSGTWLMIVDNVDDFTSFMTETVNTGRTLFEYIPKSLNGSILYTTRSRDFGVDLAKDVLSVSLMTQKEASSLLSMLSGTGDLNDPQQCDALCRALGNLPLAISQAATYMSKRHMSVTKYLELYSAEKTERRLLSHKFISPGREDRHSESVESTFEMSFEVIRTENPRATDLLSLMGFLDREGIPEYLLTLESDAPLDFEDAIAVLLALSLVSKNEYGDIYNVHRLIHILIRGWVDRRGGTKKWSSQALKTVAARFPNSEFENWTACAELVPHADTVLHRKYEDIPDVMAQALLLLKLSSYQGRRGRLELAETLARGSLHLREELLGEGHPDTLRSCNNLASVLLTRGKYEEALKIESTIMKHLEIASGTWSHDTLISMGNVAGVLQKQGNLPEAESIQRKVLEGQREMLGDKDLNTLRSYCKLASILQELYELTEAETLYRKALQILKSKWGLEHPETLDCIRDLASLLFLKGEDAEAESLRRQAVETYEKILGSEHPDTLTSIRNMGLEFQGRGRLAEAEAVYRRVLSGRQRVLGPEHPDTLNSITDLASALEDEGKYDEAKKVVFEHSSERASLRVPQLSVEAAYQQTMQPSEVIYQKTIRASDSSFLTVEQAEHWRMDKKRGVRKSRDLIGGFLRDRLRRRDHIFLIDDSSSMSKHWQELGRLFGVLAYLAKESDPDSIEICFANSSVRALAKTSSQLVSVLDKITPAEEPNIMRPLNSILDSFESNLSRGQRGRRFATFARSESRPLNIYILTDGHWPHLRTQNSILQRLKGLTENITTLGLEKKQLGIQFISFGNNPDDLRRLQSIDNSLSESTDIVDLEPSNGNVWKMLLGSIQNTFDFDD